MLSKSRLHQKEAEELMDKNKFSEKLKEGISVREIEEFARKHSSEVFSVLAMIVATISSIYNFFMNGAGFSIFIAAIGCIAAILFPVPIERRLKQLYNFLGSQERMTQIVLGVLKIVIALFIPFLIFALGGLLSGSSYHYYMRHAQIISENKPSKSHKHDSGEHD